MIVTEEAAPGLKYKAALGVAYGAGLRVSEGQQAARGTPRRAVPSSQEAHPREISVKSASQRTPAHPATPRYPSA